MTRGREPLRTEKLRDFHIQVAVYGSIAERTMSVQELLLVVWRDGFEALGIPFLPHLARFETIHPGSSSTYHQVIYGVHAPSRPSARQILESMRMALAKHGQHGAHAVVTIYSIERSIADVATDAARHQEVLSI